MKKIYFAGSIRGGRGDVERYKQMLDFMMNLKGWAVLTEHVGLKSLTSTGEERTDQAIHDRDMAWIQEADAIIAEVTQPSLGVGYEIAKAEDLSKPILCLFRRSEDQRLSAMLAGSPLVVNVEYTTTHEAETAITDFLNNV